MVDRYTKRDAQRCLERLAKMFKREHTECWVKVDGKTEAKVGCWYLDHNAIYGGGLVEEIANKRGIVSEPFGSQRRKPREFCDTVDFVDRALRLRGRR